MDSATTQETTPLFQLVHVAKIILGQSIDLVQNHLTSDEQLTAESVHLPGSTIGKHLRHARDHFSLLAECILSSDYPRILSYDVRVRNTPMEGSRQASLEALQKGGRRLLTPDLSLLDKFQEIAQLDKVLQLAPSMDTAVTLNAVTPHMQIFETTYGRELWFACLHCVHHWGMVRVLASIQGISTIPDDFGFAPSTLLYQDRSAPLGKLAKI